MKKLLAAAAIAALSVAGLPSDRFAFEGFLPPKKKARAERLQGLANHTSTLIFFETGRRITGLLEDVGTVFGPDRRMTIARELSKKFEQTRRGTAIELLAWLGADAVRLKGEFVVVVEGAVPAPSASLRCVVLLCFLLWLFRLFRLLRPFDG